MVDILESDGDSGSDAAAPDESLAKKTVRGAGWMVTWRFATRTLDALSTFVLARLLSPREAGAHDRDETGSGGRTRTGDLRIMIPLL
jgi:hypothetical protein